MKQNWTKQIILFLAGQTVTLFGSSLVQFAISWHITLTTKSGLMLTIATLCGFLPQVLIALFAGVWADRFDRKKLIMLADGMIAVATAVLAVLFTLGFERLWLLFVISAIRSFGAGVQMPAVSAILPDIVPQEKLMRVNGINASIQGIMALLSPVAAGGLYSLIGLQAAFWVDVLTAAVGISLMLALRVVRQAPPAEERPHVFEDMFSGIRYVIQTKWLRQFLGFYLIYALMFGPVMFLTPLMVARSFGEETWRLVAHEIVFAVGMTAGGIVASVFAEKFRNKVLLVVMACVAFGVTTLVMGFSPNFWFYLGVMLPMGVTIPFVNTGSMTVLQTRVEPEAMGRVFGLVSTIGSGAMPLSMAVFGPISDTVSVETLLIVTGALMVAIALTSLRFPEMLAAGKSR
jgi:DHA3 family macrolide efflux protein-like MFS transporter